MPTVAREVMETSFLSLSPQATIAEAGEVFRRAADTAGRTVFGLMVIDEAGKPVGMLSMYDIFLLIRPKHIHIWGEMEDLDVAGIIDRACAKAKQVRVSDVMTTDLITISPETHLLHVIDIMIKRHVRRLPVIEDGRVVGLVYMSRVFRRLLERLA
ncbi:MAG: CBS domain-containing protein [Deltaproteobacteria bacterium]|nr:CBS domain-containing protein [Deltaproteobacteria bacterium]